MTSEVSCTRETMLAAKPTGSIERVFRGGKKGEWIDGCLIYLSFTGSCMRLYGDGSSAHRRHAAVSRKGVK
jgi:hypothetical protein